MVATTLAVIAFLTTLLSALGETRRKEIVGLKGITKLGWMLLGFALIVLVLSATKAVMSARVEAEMSNDRAIAKRAAYVQISAALRDLESAMPVFTYLPPMFTRPITKEDIDQGNLPLRHEQPSNDEVVAARTRWIQTTKVSIFSDFIKKAASQLREANTAYLPYLPGKTVAKINTLLADSAIEAYTLASPDKDRTLERAMYDEREILTFQRNVISLYCELQENLKALEPKSADNWMESKDVCPNPPR